MLRRLTPFLALFALFVLLPVRSSTFLPDLSAHTNAASAPPADADSPTPHTYYLNKNRQASGDHEVHRDDCRYVPAPRNRLDLGEFTNCRDAIREAKRRGYPTADGCSFCAPACDHG